MNRAQSTNDIPLELGPVRATKTFVYPVNRFSFVHEEIQVAAPGADDRRRRAAGIRAPQP